MAEPKIFSVSQINRYIKNTLEKDFILNSLWVRGEVSNFKANHTGHLYFTLKDERAAVNCVMFRQNAELMPFSLSNGLSVIVCGYISLYEKTGQYQVYCEIVVPEGEGGLSLAFRQQKERLEAEGLFDEDYKREICKRPACIAVVTSPTGAVVKDVISIARRRNPDVQIVVVPVAVQGVNASQEIVTALELVNRWKKADTIILGRGGGSAEDLWPFNEEVVARAIFASEIPVISAVGHETDFSISDYVADLRAPTPSAAAELAVNDKAEDWNQINRLKHRIEAVVHYKIKAGFDRLLSLQERPVLKRPLTTVLNHRIYLEQLEKRIGICMNHTFVKKKLQLQILLEKLEALSPMKLLAKGYGLISDSNGNLIATIRNTQLNDSIRIELADGYLMAQVTGKEKRE